MRVSRFEKKTPELRQAAQPSVRFTLVIKPDLSLTSLSQSIFQQLVQVFQNWGFSPAWVVAASELEPGGLVAAG